MLKYKELWIFQNDEIVKDYIINEIWKLELVLVEIHQSLWKEDDELKEKIYINLADIKASLMSKTGLNLSLIYNRVNLMYDDILDKIDSFTYDESYRYTWVFVVLINYLKSILDPEWAGADMLEREKILSKEDIEKIIFSH